MKASPAPSTLYTSTAKPHHDTSSMLCGMRSGNTTQHARRACRPGCGCRHGCFQGGNRIDSAAENADSSSVPTMRSHSATQFAACVTLRLLQSGFAQIFGRPVPEHGDSRRRTPPCSRCLTYRAGRHLPQYAGAGEVCAVNEHGAAEASHAASRSCSAQRISAQFSGRRAAKVSRSRIPVFTKAVRRAISEDTANVTPFADELLADEAPM